MPSPISAMRPCPICSAAAGIEVQRQDLQLAGLGAAHIAFGHCGACGHIYQVGPAPADLIERHYASFSNYTCFDVEAARAAPPSPLTRRLLSLAEAHAPKPGRAYEVGCATGPHLVHFRKAGWSVGGCDPSSKACAQADEIHGIEVDCAAEVEAFRTRKGLDLVVFSHVLEHLTDPRAALVRARDSLSADGLVLLEVPCAVAPHLLPPGWFTFEHLHYFSEASLLSMLRSAGLEPLELRIAFEAYIYPVIAVIARRAGEPQGAPADDLAVEHTRRFLAEYLSRDEAFWRNSTRRLCEFDGSIYVWGAGVHTAQLFDRTPLLRHAKVVGIVDRDSQKWGCEQAGFKIVSPDHFFTYGAGAPVVISSFAAEEEIAVALAKAGLAQERIIRLYG